MRLALLVAEIRARLAAAGSAEPLADARRLIGAATGLTLTDFVLQAEQPVSDSQAEAAAAMAARCEAGEPLHRILGHREFYGLDLALSPATLEPRPDTEILVDAVLPHLKHVSASKGEARILDLGTGSGAICLALLKECPRASGLGSDVAAEALQTARRNAERHGLGARFSTVPSDWFSNIEGRFDLIVSNPPYIRRDEIATLAPGVRDFDPLLALDGGKDGLDAYRAIAAGARGFLNEGGLVGLEIGHDQREAVSALFAANGYALREAWRDYGGNDRVLLFGLAADHGINAKG